MKQVTAYKYNGALFSTERAAREAEFDDLMVRTLRATSAEPITTADFLLFAQAVRSGIYPGATARLIEAVDYLRTHKAVLYGRPEPSDKADASLAGAVTTQT